MTWEEQHRPRFEAISEAADIGEGDVVVDAGVEPFQLAEYLLNDADPAPGEIEYIGLAYGNLGETWRRDVAGYDVDVRECNVEEEWPVDDDTADVVVMGAILEHLFDPLAALEEARRVVADDGYFVLSTPNATRLIQRARFVLGRNIWDGFAPNPYHRHNHEWTESELVDILRAAGWRVTEHNHVALNRNGLAGAALKTLTQLHDGWQDQHVIRAAPAEPTGEPDLYRESLVERGTDESTTAQ
ncbi:methyltransferase domain-containing protein [Halarchaeum sp. P4]|uniref:methyltransferase domain-containing protein n=1 Tax=Halarchaeum sp. P4 TaxID=3421639 RepID=UPI003EBA00E5